MKKSQNLAYANLREVWLCYLMFKNHEITGKIGFQFSKLTFSRVGEQAICKFAWIQGKYQKVSVGIKFGKSLLTSCVLASMPSLPSVIECCSSNNIE